MTKGENELYVTDRHHLRSINLSSQVVSTLAGGEEEGERDGQVRLHIHRFPSNVFFMNDFDFIISLFLFFQYREVKALSINQMPLQ